MYTKENIIQAIDTVFRLQNLTDHQELLEIFHEVFNINKTVLNIYNQARTVYYCETTTPKSGPIPHPGMELFQCRATLLLTTGHTASGDDVIAAHQLELWLLENMTLAMVSNYGLAKRCADGLHLMENRRWIGDYTIPGEFPIAPEQLIVQLFELSIATEPKPHFLRRM